MKKMSMLAATALIFAAGTICFAQQAVPAHTSAVSAVKSGEYRAAVGTVKSVTAADPAKGVKPEITILYDKGLAVVFSVKGTTTVYDADFKAVSFDKVKAGDKVKIKYVSASEGVKEAVSVNLVK